MEEVKFNQKLLTLQENMLNFAYILTSNREDAYDLLNIIICYDKIVFIVVKCSLFRKKLLNLSY